MKEKLIILFAIFISMATGQASALSNDVDEDTQERIKNLIIQHHKENCTSLPKAIFNNAFCEGATPEYDDWRIYFKDHSTRRAAKEERNMRDNPRDRDYYYVTYKVSLARPSGGESSITPDHRIFVEPNGEFDIDSIRW